MFSFNVTSVSTPSSTAFEHGCEYPAQIVGIWSAIKEWQGQDKKGLGLLVAISDENGKIAYRTLFMSLEGYVLGARATYCKIMQGLLRCSDTDGALQKKIVEAGLADVTALVGRPCLARMSVKEQGNKSWANIDTISGETARAKGLSVEVSTLPVVDVQKVFGKFISIPDTTDCVHIPGLLTTGEDIPVDEGIDSVINDALF